MEILQLIFLGLAVGLLSSFFGIGGGSLIVPVMYGLYIQLPPTMVVSISLGSIFIIATSNVYKFNKQKLLPNKDLIINFVIFCSIGAFLGAQVVYLIDTKLAKFVMGIILAFMVLKILFMKKIEIAETDNYSPHKTAFAFTGFAGAFISSITGLGGGIIFTPVFMNILKVPTKRVSPYSNLAMLITTLIGVIPHLFVELKGEEIFKQAWLNQAFVGQVNLAIIGIIATASLLTSSIGVKLNSTVPTQTKKYLLAVLIAVFSIKLLFF